MAKKKRKRKRKPKAKMGRPVKGIDWTEFDKLCGIQSTLREMSSWFGVSEDTVERRVQEKHGITFAEYYAQKAGVGKVSLRRKQLELALGGKGDKTMLIWLGKQYLKQADKNTHDLGDTTKETLTDLIKRIMKD